MSPYSSAPRRGYAMVHHTGAPSSHTHYDNRYCQYGYDFTVDRNGTIYVCGTRWQQSSGAHAIGCNCRAVGIAMHGCFGGCPSGNVSAPSKAQECAVAFLLSHLGTPDLASRLLPHRHCGYWNPCGSSNPTHTVCCGTNFTTTSTVNFNWNAAGVSLRERIRNYRRNWDSHHCCDPSNQVCPTEVRS